MRAAGRRASRLNLTRLGFPLAGTFALLLASSAFAQETRVQLDRDSAGQWAATITLMPSSQSCGISESRSDADPSIALAKAILSAEAAVRLYQASLLEIRQRMLFEAVP